MKALVLKKYNNFEYQDIPNPERGESEVIVEIKACGICGSDVHGMDGSTGRRIPPIVMGHEASGIIKEIGSNIKNWKVGDRVTFDSTIYPQDDWYTKRGQYNLSDDRMVLGVSCEEYRRDGAFAEFVAVPEHILYKIPDSVSFNQAAMVEPAAVALHAISLSDNSEDSVVVVMGVGMIGLLVVQLLKWKGCKKIIAVDVSRNRLELAEKYGADVQIDANNPDAQKIILLNSENRGADLIFEAVGLESTINSSIKYVRKGGSLILIGNLDSSINLPLQQIVTRQIQLQGSCAICGEYSEILDLISRGEIKVDEFISAAAPLSDGNEWFERLYKKEPGLMKVILNP